MNGEIKTVVVLGPSSDQGLPLIQALYDGGLTPIAAPRRLDAMTGTVFPDIETVHADLMDVETLTKAFMGRDAAAFSLRFTFDFDVAAQFGRNIAEAANAANLKKVVFNTSCFVAETDLGISAHDGRREIERSIAASGVNYVFIEPVVFMNNISAPWCKPGILNTKTFTYPASETLKISWICLEDVPRIMVAALKSDSVDRQHVPVGGPEALTGFEIAEGLTAAAGYPISFDSITPSEFAASMSEKVTGSRDVTPGSVYEGMAKFYAFYNDQPVSPLVVDPKSITDKLPVTLTSFKDWSARQDWSR